MEGLEGEREGDVMDRREARWSGRGSSRVRGLSTRTRVRGLEEEGVAVDSSRFFLEAAEWRTPRRPRVGRGGSLGSIDGGRWWG